MKRMARRRLRLRGSAAATRLARRLGRARATQRGILHAGMALRWRRAAIGRRRVPLTQVTRPLGSCAAPVHLHFGFAFEAAPRAGIARILCHASMERLNVTRALETRTWATRLVFAGQQERLGRASRASRARLPAEHAPGPVLRRAQDMTPSLAGRIARATGLAHGATRVARHRAAGPMTFLAPARRVVEDLHAAPAPALRLRRAAHAAHTESPRKPVPLSGSSVSPQLVWRKAAAPADSGNSPAHEEPRTLPGFARPAPSVGTAHSTDAQVASQRTAAAALDPAMVDRLADDVIRRMERRIRIERERRGI